MSSSLKEILDAGEHQVQIVGIELGKSKFKGTSYLKLKFENPSGVILKKLYLCESSLPHFRRLFSAVNQHDINTLEQVELNIKELFGKKLNVKIIEKRTEGTSKAWRDVIDFFLSVSSLNDTAGQVCLEGKEYLSDKDKYIAYAKELFEDYYTSRELNYLDLIINEHLTNNELWLESEEERYNSERKEEEDYEEQQRKWSDENEESRGIDDENRYSKYGGKYDLDDETIDEAFGGDPECYWNID